MFLFHIPQCPIQNRNMYISVLNGALWEIEQVHSGICEVGQLFCCGAQLSGFSYILHAYVTGASEATLVKMGK